MLSAHVSNFLWTRDNSITYNTRACRHRGPNTLFKYCVTIAISNDGLTVFRHRQTHILTPTSADQQEGAQMQHEVHTGPS